MSIRQFLIISVFLLGFSSSICFAQYNGKKPTLNLQQADQKLIHFGFTLGLNAPDFGIRNAGYVDEDGKAWFADTKGFIPGFTVGVISDLRICNGLNLRFIPTLHFGERRVTFVDDKGNLKDEETNPVSMKSTLIYFPFYIKYSAFRKLNHKPYLIAGGGPVIDLTRKKGEPLLLKPFDVYVEFGVGWTFYLKYFRLSPEFKICLGMLNVNETNRQDLLDNSQKRFTNTISRMTSRLLVLTFNFE